MTEIRHFYFHIPFCPKLCPYCSFYVEVGAKNKNHDFLDALLREVESAAGRYTLRPETIYFGGGTPTALLTGQLDHLLAGLRSRLDLSGVCEWTIEANPATVRADKARVLRDMGITRVSLGVQSWDDALLRTLGRVHTAAQAARTFDVLRETGFASMNVDLMFAVPGQSPAQWQATLDRTVALAPDHISSYCLTYEEDTEFFRKLTGGHFRQDEEADAQLFEQTMDTLESAGFAQYEISNYARPGHESQHNRAYWLGRDYLGFGPGAFSTVGFARWENVRDTAAYTRRMLDGVPVRGPLEEMPGPVRRSEIAAFRIRMAEGVPRRELAPWAGEIAEFERVGLLEDRGESVRLTRRGKLLADSVAEAFVEPVPAAAHG
jgi:oxygen-independent coproporphyrinogen-3 oxidase